jgi:NADPH:quinone reductase-like Zn-dependent oxidoreductase
MMKAVICTKYGPPEVLELREVEKPAPKEDQLLIKIAATAVTASDCIVRGFKLPRWHPMGFMMGLVVGFTAPRNPILGMVLAGEVEAAGPKVRRFQVGDPVYGSTLRSSTDLNFGTYAQYIALPENSLVAKKPANISDEEAAAIPYGFGLANAFLERGGIASRQNVLIYGASGAIGSTAVQLAKVHGARVTGVCSTRNIALLQSLGADLVLDYTTTDAPPVDERYDLILDAVGKAKSSALKERCRQALMPDGQYISVDDGNPHYSIAALSKLNQWVAAGQLRAVIDRTYPLEEIVAAHRYVDQGHKKGNVVITVAHDR